MPRKPQPLFGKHRICAVIAAPTARAMAAQLRAALKLTRTAEIRLDWLQKDKDISVFLTWLGSNRPPATLIATCRHRRTGGRFSGSEFLQAGTLVVAGECGSQWCDTELEAASLQPRGVLGPLMKPLRFLTSFHDFRSTPSGLRAIVRRLKHCGGDAIKIATQCNSIGDSLRVLDLARGRRDVIAVPMGEIGLPARVLALKHGSALAYASVGEKTAPGQLTLDEMKNLYRADELDRRSRVYGVIGNPVSHSLSPLLHNTGFIARRMNDVYLPFLAPDLRDFLRAINPLGIAGFSITLPHKQAILHHLDDCDPLAAAIGAVNTVVVRGGGKLYGYNTDYVGVLRALQKRVRLAGSRVLLYGAGGAARAVGLALAQEGAVVAICARRPREAAKLARAVNGEVIARKRLRREFFDAIVNTTPVGMHPHAGQSPLATNELNCRLVFDLIYRPMKTKLLKLAEQRDIETVSGVEMFIAQGTAQWEIWTGLRAPVAAMRKAVLTALRRESS